MAGFRLRWQHNVRPPSYDKKIGLVLQGGGALGSYQAGVYEALASSEYLPDWVAGISIGAINAAIIVGNRPENRVKCLRSFWEEVTAQTNLVQSAPVGSPAVWQQTSSALTALMFGQPGFFTPRAPKDWLSPGNRVSYYDTSVLKGTLERLVDFNRINSTEDMRLSVGAVNVRTGQFSYFDSAKMTIRPEHVMASSALPPGFPPVEIDGEHYWDGGLFSNTPLEYVLDYSPRRSRLTFQVDLFHALKADCRLISLRLANATRIFAIPAERMFVRMPFVTGTTCGMPSMSCTNYCRRNSRARNKPSGSMSMVV